MRQTPKIKVNEIQKANRFSVRVGDEGIDKNSAREKMGTQLARHAHRCLRCNPATRRMLRKEKGNHNTKKRRLVDSITQTIRTLVGSST